jgi:hypothetical protein
MNKNEMEKHRRYRNLNMKLQTLQPFAERMAVARIFVELGNPLKSLSSWPWSTAGTAQTRIGTQKTMLISS